MLAAFVVGPHALRQRPWLARRRDRLVIVVLVVGHGHFCGGAVSAGGAVPGDGAVLGEAVSLVAVEVVACGCAAPASWPWGGWPSGSVDGTVAGCEGMEVGGMAGVADCPELM
jgi:hypothetical protein